MFEDTICALATPHGVSGLAVVRVSGQNAIHAVDEFFVGKSKLQHSASHTIHYGKFVFNNTIIDSITASLFIAPHSYTGENTVEIGLHGNTIIAQQIIDILQNSGVRAATPGEFTKRAFLNGKIDITQVEAIADLLHSQTIPGTRLAAQQLYGGLTNAMKSLKEQLLSICALLEIELDFSEEDLEFAQRNEILQLLETVKQLTKNMLASYSSAQLYRSGFYIGLIGYPNTGKSSLFNALLGKNRAIVSSVEGTTRDFLEESLFINGFKVTIADTAGIRETDDIIELEGIKFAQNIITMSDILFLVNDLSLGESYSDELYSTLKDRFPKKEIVLIQNKLDLVVNPTLSELTISAKQQLGLESLKEYIANKIASISDYGNDYMINSRHYSFCQLILTDIESAISAINNQVTTELITIDIRSAINHIGSLLGESQEDEVLNTIFSRFCIGK